MSKMARTTPFCLLRSPQNTVPVAHYRLATSFNVQNRYFKTLISLVAANF